MRVWRDSSLSAVTAGLVAVLVSYAGPLAIVIQAAQAARLDAAHLSSWIWAISIGSGLVGIALTLATRAPILAAWSTPGTALLVTSLGHYTLPQAVGAYLCAAALTVVVGVSGVFSGLMRRVPVEIVAAMLAGILLRFGLGAVDALRHGPLIAGGMFAAYLLSKRVLPRYALAVTLAAGVLLALASHQFAAGSVHLALARPVFTVPTFRVDAVVGLGIPLFLLAMTSQNAPGIAALRAAGYDPPVDRAVLATGAASLVLAPFGAPGINLAAITAAICAGPDAHRDPARRYVAGLSCGLGYLVVGSFGAVVAGLFLTLPAALVATMAGIALFGALGNGLATALADVRGRESALIAFLVTGSGVSLLGLGSPFWGLVFGVATRLVLTATTPRRDSPNAPAADTADAPGPGTADRPAADTADAPGSGPL